MSQARVLVVDDSKAIRSFLGNMLRDGIQADITEAPDGVQGLELAKDNYFDLIVSDIDMPRMNGFELCRQLKNEQSTRAVPVVILSTNDKDDYIEQGFDVGAAAYVTKGNAATDLIPRIREVLDKALLLRDKLVLVVDDSTFIIKTVEQGLAQAGFRVITASNGQEALAILKDAKPDLILSDIMMPVMGGMEFLENVRKHSALAETPFVAMSSEDDRWMMRQMIERGASAFLVKPFNVDQLIITAEKLLSDHFKILLQEKKRLEGERKMLLGSISSLAQALEARDAYTRGHSESVSDICSRMAAAMNFSNDDIENIALAGRLHDIGKIGIRDDVLLKPGMLTDEEYAIIQQHPVHGAEILNPTPSMGPIIPAVLQHHEKMDGTGYPHGIKGDEIHLWARIIAVADVYDALTSGRPYREALSDSRALEIIKDTTGNHLCPDCVEVFLSVMDFKS